MDATSSPFKLPPLLILDGAMGTQVEHLLTAKAPASATPIVLDGMQFPMWATSALLSQTSVVQDVHRSFLSNGTTLLTTATYQLSLDGCKRELKSRTSGAWSHEFDDFLRKERNGSDDVDCVASVDEEHLCALVGAFAVKCARRAIEDRRSRGDASNAAVVLVGGSLGPYGATLPGAQEFTGEYALSREQYFSFHAPRIHAVLFGATVKQVEEALRLCEEESDDGDSFSSSLLSRNTVDVLCFETFPLLDEARCVAQLLQRLNDRVEAIAKKRRRKTTPAFGGFRCYFSFTARWLENKDDSKTLRQTCTAAGDVWSDVVASLSRFPCVVGIGCNCSHPHVVDSAVKELLSFELATSGPLSLVAYPNSGGRYNDDLKMWTRERIGMCAEEGKESASVVRDANSDSDKDVEKSNNEVIASLALSWVNSARTASLCEHALFRRGIIVGGCCHSTPATIERISSACAKDSA